ncbi:hypothetical protein PC116_g16919 [Phytophthora cactorum]|uniref:Uncharacterized protein n=1 Tax=Phytophthora cactorum TaxID=29920 RepID=A0A8T1BWQ6_9STRA|nr:hypothetical protein PC112_g12991 [Phytophthora cactorum]KAG2823137.1 hypothetical protein PC111_g10363 [Phytophthora cactorum]KAG2854290.1 hypothetical protein PC113_g13445 [Phytophthora cactorum]KAG2899423.1 hypothetical protein PC114_g13972 [Phytophthora cactorum]KAG2912327.1 hypothetical protein PC115_g12361 [Phytophthora cactorum]
MKQADAWWTPAAGGDRAGHGESAAFVARLDVGTLRSRAAGSSLGIATCTITRELAVALIGIKLITFLHCSRGPTRRKASLPAATASC